jgi:hypothetical protein
MSRLLEANQRACFDEACRELGADADGLRARLGVPPIEAWPAEVPFELASLREDALFEPEDEAAVRRAEFARFNEGHPVFRIAETRANTFGMIGSIALSGAACAAAAHVDGPVAGAAIGGAVVGALAGALLGKLRVRYTCSEPRCTSIFPEGEATRCPRCGGSVRGTLDHAQDRLEAEEAIQAGRTPADVRRDLATRDRKRKRRLALVVGFVGTVAAGFGVLAWLPRTTSVEEYLADRPELRKTKLALTGRVVEPLVGNTMVVGDDGTQLLPFRLDDGTGRMIVWCDRSKLSSPLREGDRVRVTGQSFRVADVDSYRSRFIASSVDRE